MAAFQRARSAASSFASRAVHIKIEPRTRNMRESREVLRLLKGFGDVSSFQNLAHDPVDPAPHTIIAIFQEPEAASRLIAASPLRMTIDPPPPPQPVTSPASMNIMEAFGEPLVATALPTAQESSLNPETKHGQAVERQEQNARPREFVLHADVSRQDHLATMQAKPFYWGYKLNRNSYVQEALAREVPLKAMSVLGRSSKATDTPSRLVKKRLEEINSRKSVRDLWEEEQLRGT